MNVISNNAKVDSHRSSTDSWKNIQELKEIQNVVDYQEIREKGYYLYKEKFGMVSLVKILEKTTHPDWMGFRLMVKRVLHSPWLVPHKMVFEVGYNPKMQSTPNSWHFEPGLVRVE